MQTPVASLPSSQSIKQYDLASMDYYGKEIDHYNPLRGEFGVVSTRLMKSFFYITICITLQEIDDAAEKRLNGLPMAASSDMQDEEEEETRNSEEDDSCITSLQLAAVDSYRWRLKKRQQCKMYGFVGFAVGVILLLQDYT